MWQFCWLWLCYIFATRSECLCIQNFFIIETDTETSAYPLNFFYWCLSRVNMNLALQDSLQTPTEPSNDQNKQSKTEWMFCTSFFVALISSSFSSSSCSYRHLLFHSASAPCSYSTTRTLTLTLWLSHTYPCMRFVTWHFCSATGKDI